MVEPHGKNLVYLHFLKNLVIDFDLGGETHGDRIWNFPMDLEGSLRTVIGNLRNLHSLSVRFRLSHYCASHMTHTAEVLCTSFQHSCVELVETYSKYIDIVVPPGLLQSPQHALVAAS